MNKQNAINELVNLFKTIIQDGIVTPIEVNLLQDWIDNNAVFFVGEEYDKLIVPLQNSVDDGALSEREIKNIYALIDQFA